MRLDLTQLLHVGLSSPHLMRRLRQAIEYGQRVIHTIDFDHNSLKQPVFVLLFGALREAAFLAAGTSAAAAPLSTEGPAPGACSRSSAIRQVVATQTIAIGSS